MIAPQLSAGEPLPGASDDDDDDDAIPQIDLAAPAPKSAPAKQPAGKPAAKGAAGRKPAAKHAKP
jgi:hypothetical protein